MTKRLKAIFIFALLFRIVVSFVTWHPDLNNHVDWGIRFFQYGASKFYAPQSNVWSYTWPNQPPGTIYIFVFIRKIFEFIFSGFWFLNTHVSFFPSKVMFFLEDNLYQSLLKMPAILSDIGISFLIYKILSGWGKKRAAATGAILYLVNPVIWYNSAVWGQTDATVNFLFLLGFYLLYRKKAWLSLLVVAISLYIKLSLVIFLPIYLIVILRNRPNYRQIFVGGTLSAILIGVLTLPFSGGEPFGWLYKIYTERVLTEQLHLITANAFNIWAFLTGIHERPNSAILYVFSYETWGYILFILSYIPLLWLCYRKPDERRVYWILALTAFSSFMLMTNMHERYLYPLFPYFTIISAYEGLTVLYGVISMMSLANLYNFWWTPKVTLIVKAMSAEDRMLPRVFGLVSFVVYLFVYRKFFRQVMKAKI